MRNWNVIQVEYEEFGSRVTVIGSRRTAPEARALRARAREAYRPSDRCDEVEFLVLMDGESTLM